jgi:cytochrome d ubiquinol oxidase subunit II
VINEVVAGILIAVLAIYAIFAGADFGGGLWDLLAGGDLRGRPARQLIDETITPVWEANHVWLVFALVIFWTSFPLAFAAVMTIAALPLWLAALGIVLRGAGFAFRKEVQGLHWERLLGAIFAFSSLLTPFFMGTVVGSIAAGKVSLDGQHSTLAAWTGPTSLLTGALFVAVCGYMAAIFLIGEAASRNDHRHERYFRHRAAVANVLAGALSLATLAELHHSNHVLYHGLTGRALALLILGAACGLAVLVLLMLGRSTALRALSGIGVAAVVWGWGVGQYPTLLPRTGLTLANGSAPHTTLVMIVAVSVAAVLLVVPGFLVLFWLHGHQLLSPTPPLRHGEQPAAGASTDRTVQ